MMGVHEGVGGRGLATAALAVLACACEHNAVDPSRVAAVHRAAVIALGGDVMLDFDDEPRRTHGTARLLDPGRPAPSAEVQARRATEGATLRDQLEAALHARLGWIAVRPEAHDSPGWAELPHGARDAKGLHVDQLPAFAQLVDAATPLGWSACPDARFFFGLPRPTVYAPLSALHDEMGADAFVLVQADVDRQPRTAYGPFVTVGEPPPDDHHAVVPVAHLRVLVVDRCGVVVADVEADAAASRCRVPLATEDSDLERCGIEDALGVAVDRAVGSVARDSSNASDERSAAPWP